MTLWAPEVQVDVFTRVDGKNHDTKEKQTKKQTIFFILPSFFKALIIDFIFIPLALL